MAEETELLRVKRNCHRSFECPICQDYMTPPIIQCVKGHSICVSCKWKVEKCPVCNDTFSSTRNFALEELVDNLTFPCENSVFGCKHTVFYSNKHEHTEICPYRLYECLPGMILRPNCEWKGRRGDIYKHVMKHQMCIQMNGGMICMTKKSFSIERNLIEFRIVSAHGEIFWYQACVVSALKQYFISVHYIGPQENRFKYYYKLHFISAFDSQYEIVFTSHTHPDTVKIQDLILDKGSCFCLKDNFKYFIVNGDLKFNFQIIKAV